MGTDGKSYKATQDLSITEIAKLIRKDLKDAVKAGTLPNHKASVRTSKYSGGCSIDLSIVELETDSLWFNPMRVKKENDPNYFPASNEPRSLNQAEKYMNEFERILNAYNFDKSDSQTDYFHVRYYGHAQMNYELEKRLRDKCRALTEEQAQKVWSDDQDERDKENDEKHEKYIAETTEREKDEAEEIAKNAPIAVEKITFVWSESNMIEDGYSCTKASVANGILMVAASARTAEKDLGGYYKTKVHIKWANGNEYEGRWDISSLKEGLEKADCCIGIHLECAAKYYLDSGKDLTSENKEFFQTILDGGYEVY